MLRALFATFAICLMFISPAHAADDVLVFAAASTTNAVTDLVNMYGQQGQGAAKASFASSSTLAKQIEQGAPVHIFISANPKWMNYLEEKGMIETGTRKDLLGNRIVLIAPVDSKQGDVKVGADLDLAGLLGDGRLAMGDPDHVPAGMYAKEALEKLGLWKNAATKTARAKDVRAALALVERAECPFGIVYATDAAISKKVKVVGIVPESAHPPITYPVAIVKGGINDNTDAFFKLLESADARAVFEKYGFTVK